MIYSIYTNIFEVYLKILENYLLKIKIDIY